MLWGACIKQEGFLPPNRLSIMLDPMTQLHGNKAQLIHTVSPKGSWLLCKQCYIHFPFMFDMKIICFEILAWLGMHPYFFESKEFSPLYKELWNIISLILAVVDYISHCISLTIFAHNLYILTYYTYKQAYSHTYTNTNNHIYFAITHTCIYACKHNRPPTHACMHACTPHPHTHTYTNTHTCTHTPHHSKRRKIVPSSSSTHRW